MEPQVWLAGANGRRRGAAGRRPTEIEGAPRCRDLDLAERLGFDRPRKIREIIERNIAEIEQFGCAPRRGAHVEVKMPKGGTRLEPVVEYFLNEEQALLVAVLSKAPNAPAVRAMRRIVENMGLNWASQNEKLTAQVEKYHRRVIPTVDDQGRDYPMVAMPLEKLALWLASINPNKIKSGDVRAKVECYQAESAPAKNP